MMLVDSTCDCEDEIFFGKVTARELNIIKERFLSHLVPRQLEEPFQSYSDSELETCDKPHNQNIFTHSSREYECIDWYTEEEFREKNKTYIPNDVIDFELSRETISNDNNHKVSIKEKPKFQDNGFQVISSKEAKDVISKSFNYQSRIKGVLSSSSPCNLSTENIRESSCQISPIAKHFLEEKRSLMKNEDNLDCKTSDELQKLNRSNNSPVTQDFRNKISERKKSSGKHKDLNLPIDKGESESTLDIVTSREVTDEISQNTSRKEVIKDTHELAEDVKSAVIREGTIAKRSIQEYVKIAHCIKNFHKTPRIILNRIDVASAKTHQKEHREITVSKPPNPSNSSGTKNTPGASAKRRFSHIQSPVAAYIRDPSSQVFRTPAKQPRSPQTFRNPIKRTNDEQSLPTTSQCHTTRSTPKIPFQKMPKVNYDKVHSLCPTDGTVVKKIPKKPRNSNPKVIKHTGRLLLIPLAKEYEDKLEPAELSIVLNRSASFSDTIEKTTP